MDEPALLKSRNIYLAGLYALAAIFSVRVAALPYGAENADVVLRLVTGLVSAHLVVADARAIGKPLPHSAGWQLWLFWPVAVPGCVIALRKGRGALYLVGHVVALLLLYVLVALGVRWLVA